jgi:hypothetical protein
MNAGLGVMALPAFQAGPDSSGPSFSTPALGASFGLDGVIEVAPVSGFDGQIGLSLWSMVGVASSSSTQTFSGPGVLVVPGYSTPANTQITLTTNNDGVGTGGNSAITLDGQAGAAVNLPTNNNANTDAISVILGTGSNDPGFLYQGIFASADDNRSGAFAAGANSTGGVFVASGDLTGLTVTTNTARDVLYTGGDITFGFGNSVSGDNAFSGFAGPSVRLLNQDITTDTIVDVPELATTTPANEFPLYTDSRDEQLNSFYYGASGGFSMSHTISNDVTLNLGGKLGLYAMNTSFKGSETYRVSGGEPTSVDQTATLANGPTASDNGMAYSAGITAGLTKSITPNVDIGFNFGADYLSRVATLKRSAPIAVTSSTVSSTGGTTTYTTVNSSTPTLTFGSMVAWKATASVMGHF